MNQNIDILMAVYNGADYIFAQLQSIMQQTYPHFRIFIRDDESTDQTTSLIHSFQKAHPNRIVIVPSHQRLGVIGNFSELMKHAQSPYIMFCDQDDIWLPTKIEDSLTLMHKNETSYGSDTPILIHTDLAVVDRNLNVLNPSFWTYSKLNPYHAHSLNRLLIHNVITGCTTLINKSLLKLATPIPKEAMMHDWWLGLVASAFGKIDHLDKSTMLYRQHGKNDVGAKNWKTMRTYFVQTKKALQKIGRQELRGRLEKTILQATHFLNRYEERLESNKKHLVKNYVALGTTNALHKRYLFLRHRYFKNVLAKNIGTFIFL